MAGDRGAVSVGDLIRVVRALDLPRSALPDAAVMLGLAAPMPARATATTAPPPPISPPGPAATSPRPAVRRGPAAAPERPLPAMAAPRPVELIAHPPLPTASSPPRPARPLAELVPPATGRPLRPAGLFAPRLERAILGAVVASRRPDGEPDLEALVPRIATGEAIASVPRRPVLTTRLGLRLLVDVGTGMLPFRHDVKRVVERIEHLVGEDGVERLDFDGSPLGPRGVGDGPVWDWLPYVAQRPLVPGRPVVVVTDAGLGGRSPSPLAAARQWSAFASLVSAAGSRVVLLVPYPPARRPAGLPPVVRWDRATSVRDALAATR